MIYDLRGLALAYEPKKEINSCQPCGSERGWYCMTPRHNGQLIIPPNGIHIDLAGTWPPGYHPQCYWGLIADGPTPIPYLDAETGVMGQAHWQAEFGWGFHYLRVTHEGTLADYEDRWDADTLRSRR